MTQRRTLRELRGRPVVSGYTDETETAIVRARWRNGFGVEFTEQDAERFARLLLRTVEKNREFRDRHGIKLAD